MLSNHDVVIVVHGESKKPMEFIDDQFVYARKKVRTYGGKEARDLMRKSRYFRKKYRFSPTPYEIMKLV